MTCIVAIVDRVHQEVFIGGDSAAASGWDTRSIKQSKIFKLDNMLIGYTTSFRMGQILEYYLRDLLPPLVGDEIEYMITQFVPNIREVFAVSGFMHRQESGRDSGGEFIVAINDRLFVVQEDFSVLEHREHFEAVGCGAKYALGALDALSRAGHFDAETQLDIALEAAEKFSNGVSGPFSFLSMEY